MSKFEIGQKVRVKENFTYTKDVVGKVGVIKFIRDDGKLLAVEFEEPFRLCHDCDGNCEPKRGLWLSPRMDNFELVPEPAKDFKWKKWSIVKVVEEVDTYNEKHRGRSLLGKQGVVIEEKSPEGNIGVAFFENINGHDCDGQGPDGCCWRIEKKNLEYVGKLMSVEHDDVKGEEKVTFNVKDVVKYVGDEYPTRKNQRCTVVDVFNGLYGIKFNDGFEAIVVTANLKKLYTKEEVEAMAIARRKFTINDIVGIYPNEDKRVVVVKFNDNAEPIRVNCSADDNFDVTIAVALAIAYKNTGSKNKFKKKIAEKTKVIKSKPKKEDKGDKVGFVTFTDAWKAFDNIFVDSNNAFNKLFGKNIEASFGQRVKTARKAKGLSQTQLANLVGVVPSAVCHWENDKALPSPEIRKLLEKELDL